MNKKESLSVSMLKLIMSVTLIVMLGLLFGAVGYLIKDWATAPIHYISHPNDFCQSFKLEACYGKRVKVIGTFESLKGYTAGVIVNPEKAESIFLEGFTEDYKTINYYDSKKVEVIGIIEKHSCPTATQCWGRMVIKHIDSIKILENQEDLTISTDKTEYEQGENIKITVKNDLDKKMRIGFPPYSIEKFDNGVWIEIKTVFCPCEALCKLGASIVQPNGITEYQWNQKESWCSDPKRISTTISNQVDPGIYRIKTQISNEDGSNRKTIYSSEFTIKEKTSEILTPDYVLKHSEELINKSISVEGTANNNKNKVICTKGPGCNKCYSPLILEESGQSIEISGRLINTIIICTGTDCEGIKECIPLTKGKFYVVKGIWNEKSLDIESWTEKSAIDSRCGQKVEFDRLCAPGSLFRGYEFDSGTEKCVEKQEIACPPASKTPFNSLEECRKVCEKSNEKKLEFETIEKESYNYYKKAENLVIKNIKDWTDLWNSLGHSAPLPAIDFNEEMILAVFQGEKSTGGDGIEINRISEKENEIEVSILEISPGRGCMVTKMLPSPYHNHIVKLAKQDKEIKFNVTKMTNNCEAYSQ